MLSLALSLLLLALPRSTCAFFSPSRHAPVDRERFHQSPHRLDALPPSAHFASSIADAGAHVSTGLPPYSADFTSLITNGGSQISTILVAAEDIGIDEAFKDDITFLDPTIKLELGIFAAVVVLLAVVSALLNKVDDAISSVLVDFESAMKAMYASRWIEIEEELEGLDEAERTEALMKIMERMEREEPKIMERVNAEMGRNS